jgi:hypothetical protein
MTTTPSSPRKDSDPSQWTIDEFAQKANDALSAKMAEGSSAKSADSRMASLMTPRNLRRLVSQGAIDSPERQGRDAYFGPRHLEQVLAARELMSQGFTSSSVQALRNASSTKDVDISYSSRDEQTLEPYPSPLLSSSASADLGSISAITSSSLYMPEASAHSFYSAPQAPEASAAPPKQSTAEALKFLAQVSPAQITRSMSIDMLAESAALSGSNIQAPSHEAWKLTNAIRFGAPSLPNTIAEESGLAKAYQTLGASKSASLPTKTTARIASSLEAEPFHGLRLSVKGHEGMAPLNAAQKAAAIDTIEQLWTAALAAQNAAPRSLGAGDSPPTSPQSIHSPKDHP